MCGIAGCYQQADGQKLVDVMSDRIAHRGPDATGTWSHEDDHVAVQLGHRRLSIIDLSSAADQPLSKNGLTLIYNGELYNYRALRAELAAQGVRFATHSDTEVVLEAWRSWGPGALRRFRGMFAFALFDTRTGDLVLARDPLGIKPLYYLPRGPGAIFASELKALVTAMAKGDIAGAQTWHRKLFPLCRDMLGVATNPIPLKAALKLLGRGTGELRLPMTPLDAAAEAKVRQTLVNYGLLK